jgi:hypothetical protein
MIADAHSAEDEETKLDPKLNSYVFGAPISENPELMYLANSSDLIDLLVKFNISQNFPQLYCSHHVQELEKQQKFLHSETINSWQKQRMARVTKIFLEYKEKGWFMRDSLDSLADPFEQPNELPSY